MAQRGGSQRAWKYFADKYDRDGDGRITPEEYDRGAKKFDRLDRDDDGILSAGDWDSASGRFARRGERPRVVAPKAGDPAPDFHLPYVKQPGDTEQLSSFAGEKPVALIFGSYT